jgi:hypothetical protein
VGGRSTVDVTVAHQRTPKVHFWFGGTGKKGHLLLIPIATSATEPVLGVLAVDTLRKSQASHTSVNFDQVSAENSACPISSPGRIFQPNSQFESRRRIELI